MCAVTARCSQCASGEVDTIACKLPTKLRILVVKILHGVSKPVAVPENDHHVTVSACQMLHLLINIFPHFARHDTNCVANANGNFWALFYFPLFWQLASQ